MQITWMSRHHSKYSRLRSATDSCPPDPGTSLTFLQITLSLRSSPLSAFGPRRKLSQTATLEIECESANRSEGSPAAHHLSLP